MDDSSSKSEPGVPEVASCDGEGSNCSRESGGCGTQRRKLLAVLSGAATASVAGCVGLFGEPQQRPETPEETPTEEPTESGGDVTEYDVEFSKQEETIPVAENEELLYAGLDEGWDLPYQCEVGVCGQCTARVDGNGHDLVEMSDNSVLDDSQIENGYVLTCTGQPRGEFAIETGVDPSEGGGEEESTEEPTEEQEDVTEHDIEFAKQGETIPVAENEALLYAGLDEGWDLPYQCEVGVCGQCTAKVDGNGQELVEMSDNKVLSDEEIQEGYVLTCTGEPRSEFAIETGEKP